MTVNNRKTCTFAVKMINRVWNSNFYSRFWKGDQKVEKHPDYIRNQLVHYNFYWSDARYQCSHAKINIFHADDDDSIHSFLAISREFSIFQSSVVCIPPVTERTHNTVKAYRRVQHKHLPTVHSRLLNRFRNSQSKWNLHRYEQQQHLGQQRGKTRAPLGVLMYRKTVSGKDEAVRT